MPLRTDRGKRAALRHFWTWPLQSVRHLAVTAAAAAVVASGIAFAANAIHRPQPHATAATTSPVSAPQSTYPSWSLAPSAAASTTTDPSTATATTSPAPSTITGQGGGTDLAVAAAKNFMARWVRPPAGTTSDAWTRGLAPFVMPESLVELKTISPDNVPATKVTGEPKVTDNASSAVGVDVPTDAGLVHVVVVNLPDGRWLVRKWLPVP